ncbi:unnamed protein product [Lactuca virosa]|uniref:Uncharacterized protein n=1 Tax=Lactuca virosa TaxID=75947 RepID=A0AAU9MZ20_9ASTR|nr:unnamed protein product [Lactuca virosa]
MQFDQILGFGDASDTSDVLLVNDGGAEPKFSKGNASYVLPNIIKISVEEITDLLEAGYSKVEIESTRVQIKPNDTLPELNEEEHVVDEGEGDFLNDVINDEGDGGGVVLVKGEGDVVIEGEGGMVEVEGDVVTEGEGNVLNDGNEVDDDSNEANDEGHLKLPKLRKRSHLRGSLN